MKKHLQPFAVGVFAVGVLLSGVCGVFARDEPTPLPPPSDAESSPLRSAYALAAAGDAQGAIAAYTPLAQNGSRVAQFNLGVLYASAPALKIPTGVESVFFCGLGKPLTSDTVFQCKGINDATYVNTDGLPLQRVAAIRWIAKSAEQYHTTALDVWDRDADTADFAHKRANAAFALIKLLDPRKGADITLDICQPTCPIAHPVATPLPLSGKLWGKSFTGETAPFEVRASKGTLKGKRVHYFLKLFDATTNKMAYSVFVRHGESVRVDVPPGAYRVRFAFGAEPWFGPGRYFGRATEFGEAQDPLEFSRDGEQMRGHAILLSDIENGNMRTKHISGEMFGIE